MRRSTLTRSRLGVTAALLATSVLVVGCASAEPADDADAGSAGSGTGSTGSGTGDGGGAGDGDGDSAAGDEGSAPVVDPACPEGLTAKELAQTVDYPAADVDGDGSDDSISIGSVTGAGGSCSAALVVTTAQGAAVAALPKLQIVPPSSFVPGAAGTVGGQTVVAAPISFSPRGGGEVGLFTLVDGALMPIETPNGEPWAILSTIDDGGGIPQSIDCAGNALVHRTATSDALAGEVYVTEKRWQIDGATATKTGASNDTVTARQAPGGSGLSIFERC